MAGVALTGKADCLTDLGRHDEAATAYEHAIRIYEELQDPRSIAASKGNLANIRRFQKNYSEALHLYDDALKIFERLNEPASVAIAWHQIGYVQQDAGRYEAAEEAYQKSLNIEFEISSRAGQASTLTQLANLYSGMGRTEDAVRLHRQAAEIDVSTGDLRNEGIDHTNIALELLKLRRYDEAHLELERAIECGKPFGHVAQPWVTFNNLTYLECTVGNQTAALAARNQALAAYLAYRRDGGSPQFDTAEALARVNQDPVAARATVDDPATNYALAAEILLALETP
jgi:tetratricopeptide (TPR) repeat protein